MHVIVGQGQLDSVLQARPEDRRGFIEEAAGVLKHRKRKEKALRKLESMQANLTRLTDLTAELRRQLKPLGKQAEIARRAAGVQAELRDSRLRLLADDLLQLRVELDREVADEEAIRGRRAEVEAALEQARSREAELEQAVAADAPLVARTQETWYRLSALEERYRGTLSLAAERARLLAEEQELVHSGRDPEAMEAEAQQVRGAEAELQSELERSHAALTEIVGHRQELENELADAERALVAAARAVADRREGLAKLMGQVNALRTRASAGGDEIARLVAAATDARERAGRAEDALHQLHADVGMLDEGELGLDERHEAAVAAFEAASARVRELGQMERDAERERSTWTARADALAMGLTSKDGAGALLAAGSQLPGVLGSVAALLTVDPGHEAALAAALGAIADAVAVSSAADAVQALELLKSGDGGRAGLLVGGQPARTDRSSWPALPSGARWAADLVRSPDTVRGSVEGALDRVAVVDDLSAAQRLISEHPDVRAVTKAGDVLGTRWSAGGSSSTPSAIEIRAAVDEAQQKADEAAARHDRVHAQLSEATQRADELESDVGAALVALHESDAKLSAVAEQLAELGQEARSASAEAARLDTARAKAEEARDSDLAGLSELEERLHLAQAQADAPTEPVTDVRDSLQVRVGQARQAEMEARLTVRTGEERVRAVSGRAEQLLRSAEIEREARRRQQQPARRVRAARLWRPRFAMRRLECSCTSRRRSRLRSPSGMRCSTTAWCAKASC